MHHSTWSGRYGLTQCTSQRWHHAPGYIYSLYIMVSLWKPFDLCTPNSSRKSPLPSISVNLITTLWDVHVIIMCPQTPHIHHTFSLGESQCTLEEVLIFISGACRIPPGGFGKQCSLEFLHSTNALLPTSSTYELILRIPTCHSNYSTFKKMMTLGVKGHDGFGRV